MRVRIVTRLVKRGCRAAPAGSLRPGDGGVVGQRASEAGVSLRGVWGIGAKVFARYLVGYGLDHGGLFRDLPYVGYADAAEPDAGHGV